MAVTMHKRPSERDLLYKQSPTYRVFEDRHGRHITVTLAAKALRTYLSLGSIEAGTKMLEDMVKVREVKVTQHRTTFPFEATVDAAQLFAAMGY